MLIISPALFFSSSIKCQERSLSINLAELASLTLNADYSRALAKNLTIHLPLAWNPFTLDERERSKKLSFNPGIRFWKWYNYSGLFFGSSLSCTLYNKTKGEFRYEGVATGVSLSAGYAMMLSRSWNIELQAGLTLLHTKYDKYHKGRCGDFHDASSTSLLRPHPLSVAIVHIF
jgi:hypothetical protein